MYIELIYGLSLLISISVVSSFVDEFTEKKNLSNTCNSILQGIVFGSAAVMGMINPVTINEKAIFDGRTVMLSLAGLFYGPLAAAVGMASALGGRLFVSEGIFPIALFTILTSGIYGIICHKRMFRPCRGVLSLFSLFRFGFILHFFLMTVLIGLSLFFDYPGMNSSLLFAMIPMVLIYSAAEVLAGRPILERFLKNNAEVRYAKLFNSSSAGIALHRIVLDENKKPVDYIFLDMNPSFEEFTGLKKEEIVNKSVLQVLPDTEKEWIEKYGEVALTGKKAAFTSYSAELGKHFSVMSYSPEKEHFVAIFYDITDYVKSVEEKQRLVHALEQSRKLEAIGRLAGGIAHDYNNILNIIIGFSDLALQHLNDSDTIIETDRAELKRDLKEIVAAADRSANLVNQLLGYARKQSIQIDLIDINKEISGFSSMLCKLAGDDISLVFDLREDTHCLEFDRSQLHQILLNLVSNSRDALHQAFKDGPVPESGSKILISTQNMEFDQACALECDDQIFIHPGSYVLLSISDSGCGIPDAVRKRIFEPFYTTKDIGRGTGLGLSTVYGIVKQNHGFIDLITHIKKESPEKDSFNQHNSDGESSETSCLEKGASGTEFRIYLPVLHNTRSSLPEADVVQNRSGLAGKINDTQIASDYSRGAVLFVDDDPILRKMVTSVLEKNGYNVDSAASVSQGLDFIKKYDFDMVISDVVLPGLNGPEFMELAKNIQPDAAWLFVSGQDLEAVNKNGITLDEKNFLKKPFTNQAFINKFNDVLERRKKFRYV